MMRKVWNHPTCGADDKRQNQLREKSYRRTRLTVQFAFLCLVEFLHQPLKPGGPLQHYEDQDQAHNRDGDNRINDGQDDKADERLRLELHEASKPSLGEPRKRAHSPSRFIGTAGLASVSENGKLPYGRRFPVPTSRDSRDLQCLVAKGNKSVISSMANRTIRLQIRVLGKPVTCADMVPAFSPIEELCPEPPPK